MGGDSNKKWIHRIKNPQKNIQNKTKIGFFSRISKIFEIIYYFIKSYFIFRHEGKGHCSKKTEFFIG